MSTDPAKKNQNPEQIARDTIDKQLRDAGWTVQNKDEIDFNVGQGQAIREYHTDTGPADYVLFIDSKPIGITEAKKEALGHKITTFEEQTGDYATSKLQWIQQGAPLPFLYEATGVITRFTDQRDPKPRSRQTFSFHRPETLRRWLNQGDTLRHRLQHIPALKVDHLRDCQISAITNLEDSFNDAKPKALIQMATGAGKTFTAISFIYRLLKFAKAKRILFLVDTRNLGEQAEQEFMAFTPNDDNRKFTELYTINRLKSSYVPDDAQVCISTIQRMYSILQDKEHDESLDEENPNESSPSKKKPLPVSYNPKVPIEQFDFIVVDECHRSIYNLWQQVIDYFDSFLIGLTATPDARTFAFFKQNVVSEYTHEQAVTDGVNVGNEVYLIETEVSQQGGTVLKGLTEKREKLTRRKRWEQTDQDEKYSAKKLDRDIVNPSQIRTVIKTFRDHLPNIFPDRIDEAGAHEIPKTLIFAKTDSHADDIINIVREEFGESNEFCKKVTFGTNKGVKKIDFGDDDGKRTVKDELLIEPSKPKDVLSSFRNDYYPRIAVTVDMIATGTDVKPLECLVFMRDVKSKGYFEQMKGRGTRTIDHDTLLKTTPSAKSAKTHYVIVDAIGVTKSIKTSSPQLITKKSVPFKDLAMEVIMGSSDTDTVSSLAGRLARIEHQLTTDQKSNIEQKTNGIPLQAIIKDLFTAIDGDTIEAKALAITGLPSGSDPGDTAREQAQSELVQAAIKPLSGAAVNLIVDTCKANLQTIDNTTRDKLIKAEWQNDSIEKAKELTQQFSDFLAKHKDQLTALTIFFDQPYRLRELTFAMIAEILTKLKADAPTLAPLTVWQAYAQLDEVDPGKCPEKDLNALVSLIRRVSGLDKEVTPFVDTVRRNYQQWILQKNAGAHNTFTTEQTDWLKLIRDHIAHSFHLESEDLDYAPFDSQGGIGKMHQLFGDQMNDIIEELNGTLVA